MLFEIVCVFVYVCFVSVVLIYRVMFLCFLVYVVIVIDSDLKQKFHQVVQKLTYSAAHCRTFLHRVELHLLSSPLIQLQSQS